jgi:hypothetical protein
MSRRNSEEHSQELLCHIPARQVLLDLNLLRGGFFA